jgi:hypothetical protein
MIIDQSAPNSQPLVLTGSHNWSSSANDKNDENTLIIYDAELANIFYQEFMARYNAGTPLAVNEMGTEEYGFRVYPNPAISGITIDIPKTITGTVTLRIFNQLGQLVSEKTATNGSLHSISFDVSGYPAGLYFVNLASEDHISARKLIIRN